MVRAGRGAQGNSFPYSYKLTAMIPACTSPTQAQTRQNLSIDREVSTKPQPKLRNFRQLMGARREKDCLFQGWDSS